MAWVFSDCFFTYTVSIFSSVRSFFLSQVQAAGGVYAVYDLHQLVGVALVVLLEGDGGQLAKSVVGGHHHLLPDRNPYRRLRVEQPLAATRLLLDGASWR